jgi:hypothetical protein
VTTTTTTPPPTTQADPTAKDTTSATAPRKPQ